MFLFLSSVKDKLGWVTHDCSCIHRHSITHTWGLQNAVLSHLIDSFHQWMWVKKNLLSCGVLLKQAHIHMLAFWLKGMTHIWMAPCLITTVTALVLKAAFIYFFGYHYLLSWFGERVIKQLSIFTSSRCGATSAFIWSCVFVVVVLFVVCIHLINVRVTNTHFSLSSGFGSTDSYKIYPTSC